MINNMRSQLFLGDEYSDEIDILQLQLQIKAIPLI